MNLIEENMGNVPKNGSSKKMGKTILIIIAFLVIIVVGLIVGLAIIRKNELVVNLNGKASTSIKNILIFEEDGTVYVPIKKIASYLGYDSFNGDYVNKSEEINKCYVQVKETSAEVSNYSLNSKSMYKVTNDEKKGAIYSYYNIDKAVKSINGELCTTIDGIEKGFNVKFSYNPESKRINIYTMPYLIENYEKKILDWGYIEISKNFNDQKTILKDMLIVKKGKEQDQNKKYGVVNVKNNGESVLEAKYTNISYLPDTSDFLVEDNKKVGLLSSTGERRIKIDYDNIDLLDSNSKLYVVEKDKKFGVVNNSGQYIIKLDYDEIGADLSKFPKNDIKNKYLIADNLIPLKRGNYWGFADKNGKMLVDFQYDSLGYVATSNKDTDNLLVIEGYNVIVVCKDKKYVLINSLGTLLWNGYKFDDVYMKASSTEKKYTIVINGKSYDAAEQLDRIGAKNTSKNSDNENNEEETTNTTTNTMTNTTTNVTTNTNVNSNTTVTTNQVTTITN
ncbi:MAG: WG repeat-containing protein [Clostridia bacterium]|nr:WG repeat-containing protein [Clostridia bacterium]